MWRNDLESRIKKLEKSIRWNNIFLVILCLALSGFTWRIWSILIAQEEFNTIVVQIFKSMKVM